MEQYHSFVQPEGYVIQTIRTGQWIEYSSGSAHNDLRSTGIVHAPTGRTAHAHMHVVERINRIVTEIAQTMMIDAGLSKA